MTFEQKPRGNDMANPERFKNDLRYREEIISQIKSFLKQDQLAIANGLSQAVGMSPNEFEKLVQENLPDSSMAA